MHTRLVAALDRRMQDFAVAWVRRRVPILRLVPAALIRPAIAPAAVGLRRTVSHGAIVMTVPLGVIVGLVAVLAG